MYVVGSGLAINKEGYIITNAHVVEFANNIIVKTIGSKEYSAEVIGLDKLSDIALLKIKGEDIIFAELGNSSKIIHGEWVIALGNPYNLFPISSRVS